MPDYINRPYIILLVLSILPLLTTQAQELYQMPEGRRTRWTSFENPEGAKGAGGQENQGAKGHAFDSIPAGKSITLLNLDGAGIIHRIWLTINDRSPAMLRALRIDMYWDGEEKPAVSAPLGDFFGVGLGQRVPFESALFSDPEGRSFNCIIPMPFKKGARITITNEADQSLDRIFYDINLETVQKPDPDMLYFHAYWNREQKTRLQEDFNILPRIQGKGRFLGVNMGVLTDSSYEDTWWGEGEVKMYVDNDGEFPSLVGSGTEDYIGTAWGQGTFSNQYQGSLIANPETGAFAFYRYHIPDPVYFHQNIKVTIQQIGGAPKEQLQKLQQAGAELIPISSDHAPGFDKLLEQENRPTLQDKNFPDGWVNFYRRDDVSATAYFYLDKPTSNLPALAPAKERTAELPIFK